MPYVAPDVRSRLLQSTVWPAPLSEGELNFCFTVLALDYLERAGLSYATLNAIIGAFEQAKDEFQRRVVHPYEDQKKEINGDVYP